MKIGATYLYTIVTYGYPPSIEDDFRALKDIEQMGFHFLEMEALGQEHAEALWARKAEFRSRLSDHGIHVHNFCAVDPQLVSLDPVTRGKALERFKRTTELGSYLGAETLHLASYAPPVEYISGVPYALGQEYAMPGKMTVHIPDGFHWNQVWDALVDSCQKAAEIAKTMERTVIMEPRVGETICSVDSMLRLLADVAMPNFQANFDTGHFSAQRENVPLALMKLEGQFCNVHISDNNPATAEHLPVGDGQIDWMEFFSVLKRMDYQGYLGIDLSASGTLREDMIRSARYIQDIGRMLDLNILL